MSRCLLLFLSLVLFSSSAWAGECASIREARELAEKHQMDASTLKALELLYCGEAGSHGGAAQSFDWAALSEHPDCLEMMVMWELSLAEPSLDASYQDEVKAKAETVCALRTSVEDASWSNGVTIKYMDGSLQYPNSVTARYADGSWQFPNVVTARYADGSWQYPNVVTARYADGSWQSPSVQSLTESEVLERLCAALGSDCNDWAKRVKGLPEIYVTAQIVRLMATAGH